MINPRFQIYLFQEISNQIKSGQEKELKTVLMKATTGPHYETFLDSSMAKSGIEKSIKKIFETDLKCVKV